MLTEAEINNLIEKIVHRIRPNKIIVFGFYAKGTSTNKSELDIFIVKNTVRP